MFDIDAWGVSEDAILETLAATDPPLAWWIQINQSAPHRAVSQA